MSQSQSPIAPWISRCSAWARGLTLLAVATGGVSLLLARYDIIPKLAGFAGFVGGALIALIALLLALVGLFGTRRMGFPMGGMTLAAAFIALLYAGFILTRPLAAGDAPALHDVTTDLASPPQFEQIKLRADNLAGVNTLENWKQLHAASYSDLKPIIVPGNVTDATRRAAAVAERLGWTLVAANTAKGHIEATDAVSFIRFYDDIVIRVVPAGDGGASRVDVRSVSRIGISDFGVNARRIRAFRDAMLVG